jgi:hypothetical protein
MIDNHSIFCNDFIGSKKIAGSAGSPLSATVAAGTRGVGP